MYERQTSVEAIVIYQKNCKEATVALFGIIEERTIFQLFCLVVVLGEKISNN